MQERRRIGGGEVAHGSREVVSVILEGQLRAVSSVYNEGQGASQKITPNSAGTPASAWYYFVRCADGVVGCTTRRRGCHRGVVARAADGACTGRRVQQAASCVGESCATRPRAGVSVGVRRARLAACRVGARSWRRAAGYAMRAAGRVRRRSVLLAGRGWETGRGSVDGVVAACAGSGGSCAAREVCREHGKCDAYAADVAGRKGRVDDMRVTGGKINKVAYALGIPTVPYTVTAITGVQPSVTVTVNSLPEALTAETRYLQLLSGEETILEQLAPQSEMVFEQHRRPDDVWLQT
ncbi:hypothetical protein GGX14DRAFT_405281 [Mycena pura]|uniref:Uncharacterized protein n=1 Tax=Mycena pura TaxID=153505 RepID=A0AAD6USU1_9AGAR|nr:hypothetical protein GGX14DRAFT_405281 [Mycena pura]